MTTTATTTVFSVPSRDLLRALNATKAAAHRRPSVPCLAGTLITARDGRVNLSQYDYEHQITVDLDTTAHTDGTWLIHHRVLLSTLTALRSTTTAKKADATTVTFTITDQGNPALSFGGYTMPLESLDAADYPTLPAPPEVVARFDQADYTRALAQVAPAAGTDETLPALVGIHMAVGEDGDARVSATDRYRIATVVLSPLDGMAVPGEYNIPAKAVTAVAKHWQGRTAVEFLGGESGYGLLCGVRADGITLVSRAIEQIFPKIEAVLFKPVVGSVTVDGKTLTTAVATAAKLAAATTDTTAAGAAVELRVDDQGIEVAPRSSGPERITAPSHQAKITGTPHPLRTAQAGFLSDGIRAVGADRLTVHHEQGQVLVLTQAGQDPADLKSYRYVVMCMRTP